MNKRQFLLGGAGVLAAGAALRSPAARAAEVDACGRVAEPATFVLVHGAWGGGFMYDPVADILRRRGHRVFAPTLTGVGERSHLASPEVNLTTHITDIVNVIRFNELSDVVLAGHSYGGMPITGAADKVADRVASLVYLDAVVPENGQSLLDIVGPPPGAAEMSSPGPDDYLTPIPPQFVKIFKIPEDELWKYRPQPAGTAAEPVRLTGAHETIPRKTYVWATEWPQTKPFYDRANADPAWETATVPTGHLFMRDAPERVAEILENAI